MDADFEALSHDARVGRLGQLARRALAHWRLDGARTSLLKYRENAVFKVEDPASGGCYVLRVHRPGYHSDAELRSELQWMTALREAGIEAPEVIAAASGELFVNVTQEAVAEPRQCDLLRWVEGEIIGDVEGGHIATAEETRQVQYQAGSLAARIHEHGARWQPPPGFTRPSMDFDGLIGTRPYLGHYAACPLLATDDLAMLDRARERIRLALDAFGRAADRYGLTHGDFLPENLLRAGGGVHIIDFDDCGYGWYLMEVATSLLYLLGQPNYEAAQEGFVAGYRSVRALPDEHLELLPVFLLARAMTYVGWIGSRPETPLAQERGPLIVAVTQALGRGLLGETA